MNPPNSPPMDSINVLKYQIQFLTNRIQHDQRLLNNCFFRLRYLQDEQARLQQQPSPPSTFPIPPPNQMGGPFGNQWAVPGDGQQVPLVNPTINSALPPRTEIPNVETLTQQKAPSYKDSTPTQEKNQVVQEPTPTRSLMLLQTPKQIIDMFRKTENKAFIGAINYLPNKMLNISKRTHVITHPTHANFTIHLNNLDLSQEIVVNPTNLEQQNNQIQEIWRGVETELRSLHPDCVTKVLELNKHKREDQTYTLRVKVMVELNQAEKTRVSRKMNSLRKKVHFQVKN